MNPADDITNIGPSVTGNAVSIYGQDDAMEDFPVLKAFQQYIDAEQAKARKRMVVLCAFFGVLMTIVISVFVLLLVSMSSHNQALNDRLIEFAMKDRMTPPPSGSAVVVQPPQDNSALLKLTDKLNDLQKRLAESQQAVAAAEAKADEASRPKEPTAEEKEIKRLKALLLAEKEKTALEKERQKKIELELYRRKHYPELYEQPSESRRAPVRRKIREMEKEADDEIRALLSDDDAISYYDEEETLPSEKNVESPSPAKVDQQAKPAVTSEKNYSIPVDIKGSSSNWNIPLD